MGQLPGADTDKHLLSRRQMLELCAGAAGAAALCALPGCSSDSEETDPHATEGYSSDTVIKDYALTLYIMADSKLQRHPENTGGVGRLEYFFSLYQEQAGRGEVSFAIKYMDAADIARCVTEGFSESFDGLVGISDTIELAAEQGMLYGGRANTSIRNLAGALNETLVFIKAQGSSYEMPAAKTLTGEDADDGTITKLQSLSDFEGFIALPDAELTEGVVANKLLYRNDFYTSKTGLDGEYTGGIEDKIKHYSSIDSLVSAVKSGECGLGVIATSSTWGEYSGIETVYEPNYTMTTYKGGSMTDAAEGGVMRDFLEYVSRMV